jgi:rhodanese-related sulfurtransferase
MVKRFKIIRMAGVINKRLFFSLSVLFLILISGCIGQNSGSNSNNEQLSPSKINQNELSDLIQRGGDFLLIDVRTEGEYSQGRLPGAIVIPYDEFEARYTEILEYKNKLVVLYCHVGGMGDYAGSVLLKSGFTNVKNLDGGINGWINSGGKIV